MIGTIDITVNAEHPNVPLAPVFSWRGSASRINVEGVPCLCGSWYVSSVSIAVSTPDGKTVTYPCARTCNGVWSATIDGSDVPGKSANGITITAKDEAGKDFVLGRGDLYILDSDAVPSPGDVSWTVRLLDKKPENPKDGDAYFAEDGTLMVYSGGAWRKPMPSNAVPTKLSQLENDMGFVTSSSNVFLPIMGGTLTGDLRVGNEGRIGHVIVRDSAWNERVRINGARTVDGDNFGGEIEIAGNGLRGGGRLVVQNGGYGGGEIVVNGTKGLGRASITLSCATGENTGSVEIRSGSSTWEGSAGLPASITLGDNTEDPANPRRAEIIIGGVKVRETLATKADKATTLAGYGITDAPTKTSQLENDSGFLTDKQVKLGTTPGYVANADHSVSALSAVDSETVPWSGVKFRPTTLAGYGITDAAAKAEVDALAAKVDAANTALEEVA